MVNEEWFIEHLPVIERMISFLCRRYRLDKTDAEDFASNVKLKLIENDYLVLRTFEHRSSFASFIFVIARRMLLDQHIRDWGKWRASAEAKRLGDAAIELERLTVRDARPLEEAAPIVAARYGLSRQDISRLHGRLPARQVRAQFVDLEAVEETVASEDTIESATFHGERSRLVEHASAIIRSVFDEMPLEDRRILRLHFLAELTVAEVARSLHLDQKALYRRIERCLQTVRERLAAAGIGAEHIEDMVERMSDEFASPLRIGDPGPSPQDRDAADGKGASG